MIDPIKVDPIKPFLQSSIAPVGKDNENISISGKPLPVRKSQDPNPSYFRDSIEKKKLADHDPFEQIMIKLQQSAEGQKVAAEEVKEVVGDIYVLRNGMKNLSRNLGKPDLDLDTMLMAAYKEQISLDQFMSRVHEELVTVKRGEMKEIHREKLEEMEKLVKKMKNSKVFDNFSRVFSVIAAIAGGVGIIGTGGAAAVLGVALLAVTLANTTDNVLGDPIKDAIAQKVTDGTDTQVEKFRQWCDLGIGVLQMFLGLGALGASIAGNGVQAANAGSKVLQQATVVAGATGNAGQGITTIAKAVSDYDANLTKAKMVEIDVASKRTDDHIQEILNLLTKALKQRSSSQQNLSRIANERNQLAKLR